MRHQIKTKTFGRKKGPREAMFRSLMEGLILHGKIRTTLAKAKELRRVIEPLVTKARVGTLAARRQVIKELYTAEAVKKLMEEIAPKYKEVPGGYTRIIKLGTRPNDAAEMAKIEFVK